MKDNKYFGIIILRRMEYGIWNMGKGIGRMEYGAWDMGKE